MVEVSLSSLPMTSVILARWSSERSCTQIFVQACAAALRTLAELSPAHFFTAIIWICTMSFTRIPVMTRSARARMSWLVAARSFWKELIERSASSRASGLKSA